ncbi:hypothetical protein [Streptomyces sp. 891-h]|uniref:hypothetical protein n=1 Tax=Streptomyces sp. 891-h TaxID=2720714 RepID=UPI001FAA9299|nr:hypothetical protein [Streptomyces sp. 891-h]UNZ22295.1 hypothetical protein HC362_34575 [Streptomyces sp. 891-h]
MTAEKKTGREKLVRATPAALVEHDPVDVAMGDTPTATATAADVTATRRQRHSDSDTGSDRRQATAEATATPPGDTATATGDRRQRHGDKTTGAAVATGDRAPGTLGDTTPGDGDSDSRGGDTTATDPGAGSAGTAAGTQKRNADRERMKNRSFSFPDSLYHRSRAAMWHTRHLPAAPQTHSEYVRRLVELHTRELEETHNGGQPFPAVEELPTGPGPEGAARGAALRKQGRARRSGAAQDEGEA